MATEDDHHTTTTYHGLKIPYDGQERIILGDGSIHDWGDDFEYNFEQLDERVILKGTASARSALTPTEGLWYLETDNLDIYYYNGSSWDFIAGQSGLQADENETITGEWTFADSVSIHESADASAPNPATLAPLNIRGDSNNRGITLQNYDDGVGSAVSGGAAYIMWQSDSQEKLAQIFAHPSDNEFSIYTRGTPLGGGGSTVVKRLNLSGSAENDEVLFPNVDNFVLQNTGTANTTLQIQSNDAGATTDIRFRNQSYASSLIYNLRHSPANSRLELINEQTDNTLFTWDEDDTVRALTGMTFGAGLDMGGFDITNVGDVDGYAALAGNEVISGDWVFNSTVDIRNDVEFEFGTSEDFGLHYDSVNDFLQITHDPQGNSGTPTDLWSLTPTGDLDVLNDITLGGTVDGVDVAAHAAAANPHGTDYADVGAIQDAADAVTASHIAANAVGSSEIATDAVTAAEIAANAVGSSEIATGAVDTDEIATDAVTAAEIAAGAVDTSEIATGAVTSNEIAAGTIEAANIADDAIETDAINPATFKDQPNLHLPGTELEASGGNDTATQSIYVPSGSTFYLWGWGVIDATGTSPTGVDLYLKSGDLTGTPTTEYSDTATTGWDENAGGTPLDSVAGATTVHVQMINTATTAAGNVSLTAAYTIE